MQHAVALAEGRTRLSAVPHSDSLLPDPIRHREAFTEAAGRPHYRLTGIGFTKTIAPGVTSR
ncbi:hypothetical protein GCM10014719_56750 [Planomonospora parontospora subsp. antibiotica]|nr:hypothetical protein GCM10014719_56750 [Planomonospora parontospora subsp. antibiotica]GII18783.1 hypothetical protein Ppa05_55090 [Planomonospora parontospora subsp. antibiotica]